MASRPARNESRSYVIAFLLLFGMFGSAAFVLPFEVGWGLRSRRTASMIRHGTEILHISDPRRGRLLPILRPFVYNSSRETNWKLTQRPSKTNNLDDDPNDEENVGVLESLSESSIAKTITASTTRSLAFTAFMALSGAALGPFLDSYHSAFGVLQYDSPITLTLWGTADRPALITSWWVPELFALAGVIIGWMYILLDSIRALSVAKYSHAVPAAPKILTGIALFTLQYWLSGAMFSAAVPNSTILNVMSLIAAAGFVALDGSLSGFITSAATAVGGPFIEVGLLSLSRLDVLGASGYHYADPGETGFFPLWIAPVYFLGGPAVGNLARGAWHALAASGQAPIDSLNRTAKSPPGCVVCNDTRQVPCPNCDGVGAYIAMGGRSVKCTSCRGRGFVVCRSCFTSYDDDPYDIEAIRELMSRRPD